MQVAHCYPTVLESFPQEIIDVLQTYNTVLDNEMRLVSVEELSDVSTLTDHTNFYFLHRHFPKP